ncbi:MAG: glutaminyl-peptide cyclotransferase [Microthrixaceae bacterium]
MTVRVRPVVGLVAAMVLLAVGCSSSESNDRADGTASSRDEALADGCDPVAPERLVPEIVEVTPHDATRYTQGLLVRDGVVFESAGRYGESQLAAYDLSTGEERGAVDLPDDVFAEGLALVGEDELVQLTWKEGVAYRWDVSELLAQASSVGAVEPVEPIGEFRYDGEGWGLTAVEDGSLVMSDGSDELTVRDPVDFEPISTHRVTRKDGDADALNELDWDGESLWANRYKSDELLRVDPVCWTVTGVADLSSLRDAAAEAAATQDVTIDVTNGIAHLPEEDEFLITGKWWPSTFRVRLVPA